MRKLIVLLIAVFFVFASCDGGNDKYDPQKSKLKTESAEKEFGKAFSILKDKTTSEVDECDEEGNCTEQERLKAEDLNDIDFTTSYNLFNEAVEADPNNLDAQLGAAITRILSLLKSPEFIELRDAWWDSEVDFNLADSELNKSRFKISNFINNALIPAVDYSLARLDVIDQNKNKDYKFMVTPEIYGEEDGDTFELDMGEIKEFHAFLLALKSATKIITAYKIDLDSYSLQDIKTALSKGSDFLTLLSQNKMIEGYDTAVSALDKAIEGINFILTEDDDQDDDIIRNTHDMRDSLYDFKDKLNKIKEILTTDYEIKSNGITLALTLNNFFHHSPQDLKALLPDYTVTIDDDMLNFEFNEDRLNMTFPDTTFGGFFNRALSQDEIKLFLEIYQCNENTPCYDGDPYYHCTEDFKCEYGMACNADDDCQTEWEHCGDDGYCAEGVRCSQNDDCNEWDHCNTETGLCEYGRSCQSDDDCDSDYGEFCNSENICEYRDEDDK